MLPRDLGQDIERSPEGGAGVRGDVAAGLGDGGRGPRRATFEASEGNVRSPTLRLFSLTLFTVSFLAAGQIEVFDNPAIAGTDPCPASSTFNALPAICGLGGEFTLTKGVFTGSPLTGDDLIVKPLQEPGSLGLDVMANFTGPATYTLTYTIDPPPPVILDFFMDGGSGSESLARSVIAAPTFEVVTTLCIGGFFSRDNFCTGTLLIFFINSDSPTGGVTFPFPTNFVDVIHDINLEEGGAFSGFRVTSHLSPEPSTFVLLAAPLAVLAWRRRHR